MSAAQHQQTEQDQAEPRDEAAEAAGPDQAAESASAPVESTPVEPAATPLTSLDSLLGGALEGTSACAVDGTCD